LIVANVRRSALLLHPTAAVFEIVNDVARYPEFLPWCSDAAIVEQSSNEMIASLSVSANGMTETLTTRNRLTPFEKIDMSLIAGPFREFSGGWTFTSLGGGEGCRVELALDFQFSGVRSLVGVVFKRAADQMVDAFCARASQVLE